MSSESSLSGFGSYAPFLGTYTPRLDDKGRLILPAKFRAQLAPGLVMTRGQERCLFLLPMDEFRRMHEQIRQAPVTSKQARDYLRVFLSGASDEMPDKQGRISIPPMLRTYAGLDREVAVIGAGTRVEIWDLAAWETYLAEQEAGYAETAEEVFPHGPF
ncbi:division/cell wall cluster transcriptional repressor MraZ [Cellulomonas cellasea]|uniref:Transcriptional regulator MraZ n=2 Tax=Cellulomonas cellasea TaxID=43670 RepID=A0A0A0BA12_9CELL|nr:division/cell wall cluster transcriptional repressor MraZ [Cellulomonas cellasea]KGM02131.1 cell division protein MraZ [Cellulomonas cellasea DSM 20118]MBB2925120.1 MraZ protein [Cellulomonas cellasea]GEA88259.1 transcriptional regulator MraZ [Cellulomonas cellasea]